MWISSETEGEAAKNAAYPDLPVPLELTLLLAALDWPFGFTFDVTADVAIGFCEVTLIYARMKFAEKEKSLIIRRDSIKV